MRVFAGLPTKDSAQQTAEVRASSSAAHIFCYTMDARWLES